MNAHIIDNEQMIDEVTNQLAEEMNNNHSSGFDYEKEGLIKLEVGVKGYKKIEAAAFYNDYETVEEYLSDVIFREIDLDKQKHLSLRDKEHSGNSNKAKK
jgi:hypothetical protein